MPLSEHERRVLDEIERALTSDDPAFASSIGAGQSQERRRIRWVVSAVGASLGFGLVVLGLVLANGIGDAGAAVGFVLIVVSCWAAIRAWRDRRSASPPPRAR